MSEKKELPLETHTAMGDDIREIVGRVQKIARETEAVYGDDIAPNIKTLSQAVEALRTFLDLRVFMEYPDRNGNENAEVYYAGGHKCHHGDENSSHPEKSCAQCGQQ